MTIRRTMTAATAAVMMAGAVLASSAEVQAKPKFGAGLAVGIAAGALIAGSAYAAHAYAPAYRCYWVSRYDAFGHYVGRARVCG